MHFSTVSFTLALAALQAAAMPSGLSARAGKAKSWVITFQDDFNDMSNWKCDLGHGYPNGPQNWGTNQIENDTCDLMNVIPAGNALYIMPQRAADGSWTSARLEAKKTAQCADGEQLWVQADIQLPATQNQQGIWASWWALGAGSLADVWSWPAHGEFDILEVINGKPLQQATAGLHCGVNPGGPCNEPSGLTTQLNGVHKRGQWNTYAMVIDRTTGNWKTESITFMVNGQKTVSVTGASLTNRGVSDAVARGYWQNAVYTPFTMILDVAVGGDYPGPPNDQTATAMGAGMQVRKMKIWNLR